MDYVILSGDGGGNVAIFKLTKEQAQACVSNSVGAAVSLNPAKYIDGSALSNTATFLANSGVAINGWYILKGDPAVLIPNGFTVE